MTLPVNPRESARYCMVVALGGFDGAELARPIGRGRATAIIAAWRTSASGSVRAMAISFRAHVRRPKMLQLGHGGQPHRRRAIVQRGLDDPRRVRRASSG